MTTTSEPLLPCPFCGGDGCLRPSWRVHCLGCLVQTGRYREYHFAVNAWNRRADKIKDELFGKKD
jgi:hypothetical protein